MSDTEKTKKTCSICQNEYIGWGNNAWPVNDGRCCDDCNGLHVLPERLHRLGYGVSESLVLSGAAVQSVKQHRKAPK